MLLRFAETDARIDRVVVRLGSLIVVLTVCSSRRSIIGAPWLTGRRAKIMNYPELIAIAAFTGLFTGTSLPATAQDKSAIDRAVKICVEQVHRFQPADAWETHISGSSMLTTTPQQGRCKITDGEMVTRLPSISSTNVWLARGFL